MEEGAPLTEAERLYLMEDDQTELEDLNRLWSDETLSTKLERRATALLAKALKKERKLDPSVKLQFKEAIAELERIESIVMFDVCRPLTFEAKKLRLSRSMALILSALMLLWSLCRWLTS